MQSTDSILPWSALKSRANPSPLVLRGLPDVLIQRVVILLLSWLMANAFTFIEHRFVVKTTIVRVSPARWMPCQKALPSIDTRACTFRFVAHDFELAMIALNKEQLKLQV